MPKFTSKGPYYLRSPNGHLLGEFDHLKDAQETASNDQRRRQRWKRVEARGYPVCYYSNDGYEIVVGQAKYAKLEKEP